MSPHKPHRKKNKYPAKFKKKEGDTKMKNRSLDVKVTGKVEAEFPKKFFEDTESTYKQTDAWEQKKYPLAFWTTIGVFVAALFAFWQGCSAHTSAVAARDSADRAKDAVELSRTTSHVDLRAWVGISDISPPDLNPKLPLTIPITFKNSGKTIARQFVIKIGGEYRPKGQPPQSEETILPGIGIIPPNGLYHTTLGDLDKVPDKNAVINITNGDSVVWVHGKITYNDVFKQEHWATFCYYFMPKERTTDHGAGGFALCETGNDEDTNSD